MLMFGDGWINLDPGPTAAHVAANGFGTHSVFIYMYIPLVFICLVSVFTQIKEAVARFASTATHALSSTFFLFFLHSFTPDLLNFALDVAAQWELF